MAGTKGCAHDQLEVRLCCPSCGHDFECRELSRAELESQARELPNREAMSVMADPINIATAVNWLSDNATQVASQVQNVEIVQRGN